MFDTRTRAGSHALGVVDCSLAGDAKQPERGTVPLCDVWRELLSPDEVAAPLGTAPAECRARRAQWRWLRDDILHCCAAPGSTYQCILAWPDSLVLTFAERLRALRTAARPEQLDLAELQRCDLADSNGTLTSLGASLLGIWDLQFTAGTSDFSDFVSGSAIGHASRVLDVGCAIGDALRLLRPMGQPVRIGIDIAAESIFLAAQYSRAIRDEVGYAVGSGQALPFRDESFTHVICRNALTYMHQRRALREMVRVLAKGGYLFLRVERWNYDLMRLCALVRASDRDACLRRLAGRWIDWSHGVIHELTGLQPVPGRRWSGGRAFASLRRLREILRSLGCRITHVEDGNDAPVFLGMPTQLSLVCRRS